MNISGFFIHRPIFASVVSLLIFISGLISIPSLPISEYPDVSPPSIAVSAVFPGAGASTVSETVATPLEEQINGVEGMLYMNSLASSDGSLSIRVTFAIGTDPDLAQQLVQNRVQRAIPRLPDITRQLGVTVTKSSPDITMVVHLLSPDDSYDSLYLRNYVNLNIKDQLAKLSGVGNVNIFGSADYAMRIWLDPDKVAERGLNASEVIAQIRAKNTQVAAGTIGGPPYDNGVELQLSVNVQGRLETAEQFENIIVKRDQNGVVTRLSDVARIELDAQNYGLRSMLGNKQAVAIPIFAAPNANALDISTNVRAQMKELKQYMPEGIDYDIVYDPTVFIKDSIDSVIHTLLEAIALVVLVVVIFLQSWRAAIIPLLAVPVSIVGTFAFMNIFGFSINVLSMFGLILAIGIVVDDAIVVVENVERNIDEGKSPVDATIQAMKEVTGPIIATSLVLAAVFIPIGFISGLTGQFYKQFALTIAIATFISTLNSLTLSPALAALLLKPKGKANDPLTKLINGLFGWFFRRFNKGYDATQSRYTKSVGVFTARKTIMMLIFGLLVGFTVYSFKLIPQGFIPAQDKGYLIAFAQLPSGTTLDRTENVVRQIGDIVKNEPGVKNAVQLPGISINGFVASSSGGIVFLPLDGFEDRKSPELSAGAIAQSLQQKFFMIEDAYVAVFPAPAVRGLGTLGGFKLQVQDRNNLGNEALFEVLQTVMQKGNAHPALTDVFSGFNINTPQLLADVDRTKAERLGIPLSEIFATMQVYLGSQYINDFNMFGRTYQVVAQAEKENRGTPDDILRLQVRNNDGTMVPLGSVLEVKETFGPETVSRYNAFRAADLNGNAAPGVSSGEAQAAMAQILNETLPQGMAFEWTELTYQQILAGNTALLIFPLCLLFVFLVLAAQYESLTMPLAVIMIVPMAVLSAMLGLYIMGLENNIFTQIALFVLAGLASKNAILIVEFARELEHQGRSTIEAAIESAHLRLRPILMTSIAFIMGVLPLVLASGAGAEMSQSIGVAVFSGMIGVTIFGLIFTPVFYVIFRSIGKKSDKGDHNTPQNSERTPISLDKETDPLFDD